MNTVCHTFNRIDMRTQISPLVFVLALCAALATAAASPTGADAVHAAVAADNVPLLQSLRQQDPALLNARREGSGQTPLMAACLAGKSAAVRALLAAGADFTIGEKDGFTPMHGAAFQGRTDMCVAGFFFLFPRSADTLH